MTSLYILVSVPGKDKKKRFVPFEVCSDTALEKVRRCGNEIKSLFSNEERGEQRDEQLQERARNKKKRFFLLSPAGRNAKKASERRELTRAYAKKRVRDGQ